ncbi:hypothetical protein M9H77_29922 [Catharanthus roseus]|uniref:Uncharacterized protein n=1 Tax=Catharanthus roseus TaxID=4058 RepID=A0ACB9ZVT0_CATRO|nr:hypothetical protein M9H77_29922 [Catharanthus roseus]
MKNEEDKVEFIRLAALMEFLFLPPMKVSNRTSILRGRMWVTEMLEGYPLSIWENLCIRKGPFKDLCNIKVLRGLWEDKPQKRVDVAESLAIFLFAFCGSNNHPQIAEKFQHSTETICKHILKIFRILCELFSYYICPRDWKTIHPKIYNNPNRYLFFQGMVGAIDNTCLLGQSMVFLRSTIVGRIQSCKNIMAAVDHDNSSLPWCPYHGIGSVVSVDFVVPLNYLIKGTLHCKYTFGILKKHYPYHMSAMPPYRIP